MILSETPKIEIMNDDCLNVLKNLPENSVDCIITDPPAGIGFMGEKWDNFGKGLSARDKFIGWLGLVAKECLRVLKYGGHALIWALPKTSHWTAMSWENTGFEVRDRIIYCFGSGFPKSLNIANQIAKREGAKREGAKRKGAGTRGNTFPLKNEYQEYILTENAKQWEGWGTTLKPAVEDWWLLRKPIEKGLSIAENVLKWRTGGLNIDECKVRTEKIPLHKRGKAVNTNFMSGGITPEHYGRFPSHLIIDDSEEVRSLFPNGTSRFFYCAKASRKEREMGLNDFPFLIGGGMKGTKDQTLLTGSGNIRNNKVKNNHPTVKPVALMEYLVKLICPPNGIVLDCFMGSGSTGIACVNLNKNFIGIELDKRYFEIAKARIEYVLKNKNLNLFKEDDDD